MVDFQNSVEFSLRLLSRLDENLFDSEDAITLLKLYRKHFLTRIKKIIEEEKNIEKEATKAVFFGRSGK